MYNRPTAKETEDDILKLQDEYLKHAAENKIKPAATIIKDSNYVAPNQISNVNPQIQISNTFETVPTEINIGPIHEKTFAHCNYQALPKAYDKRGFPQAKRRDPTLSGATCSIFAQQIKRLKKECNMDISTMELVVKEHIKPNDTNVSQQSYIITGDEKHTIHEENVAVLRQMSEREILEEREALITTMDPAIVAFLKSKRKESVVPNRTASIAEQNKASENFKLDEVETTKDIITQSESERWLNFDTVEVNKLAWMTDVAVPQIIKGEQYEARFDFSGWLLPFTHPTIDETNRILYHHGNEPGRPGYTLQELFQLCRSSISQQQIIALNTISNILALQQSGVYDGVIEIPFEQIFFVLRICLDDNTPSILNAAIKAFRNLFFYVIDETCLDNLLGFGLGMAQPLLAVDGNEVDDDNTVNDQQLAETNLMKCLTRTDILKRIHYIINTVQPSMETVVYCIELLIRLARDSNFIATQILKCNNLLESICNHFVPNTVILGNSTLANGYPLVQAVKLFRILAVRNRNFAELVANKYKIIDSVMYYLSAEWLSINANGLKLQIESMHLWSVLLHYNLMLDSFSVLEPILLRMLDFHVQNTNLHPCSYVLQGHVAALLNLLKEAFQLPCNMDNFNVLFKNLAINKWMKQFCSLQDFSCGKLQITTSLLRCLIHLEPMDDYEDIVLNMLQSKGFDIVTNNIQSCSNLLNNYDTHKTSANFLTVEAAIWNASDHIIPVLQTNSCVPFLRVLSELISLLPSTKVKLAFIKHKNVVKYLKYLNNTTNYGLLANWFTKVESDFIINILKIAVGVQSEIETTVFYDVAVKSLSVFNSEQKPDIQYIFTNIIFNRRFYPSETLMSGLDLNDENKMLSLGLDNLGNICSVYAQVLQLKMEKQNNLLININNTNIIPVDWIYSPIILLYSNQQNKNIIPEDQQIYTITNCLRWIFIYETYFPTLANAINPTDRFCRIACTFLCSDTLFLNPEIDYLLENCLKHIIATNEANINFSQPIQGLNNFQDFYTLLLEQYQGVSYGNILFGNFILLPLMQRHAIKYRKTLWSEYAGIVQIFNVNSEQVLYPIDLFLTPVETDLSLLKCYRKALVTGSIRKHSFLYQIANHHVSMFLNSKKISVNVTED